MHPSAFSRRARFVGPWRLPASTRALATVLLAGALAGACGGAATGEPTGSVAATLVVSLNRDSVRLGEAAQATAEGRDGAGRPASIGTITWSTSDAALATVSHTGRVTATGVGAVRIIGSAGGTLRGEATLRIYSVPVDAVVITPLRSVIAPGGTTQLSARPVDATGNALAGRPVAWLSSDSTRAVVDEHGVVTARAPGVVSIAAISEAVYGTADVRVSGPPGPVATVALEPAALGLAIGASRAVTAVLEDADGNEAVGRPVTWESLSPSVATVSAAGVVTALARGVARIRATAEGRVGIADVTVSDPADSITVAFALPVRDDIIGDTLQIFADIKSRNPIVRAQARLTTTLPYEAALVETPVGTLGLRFVWTGAIDVTFLPFGPYQVIVTAWDALGNSTVSSQSFKRGTREGKGGTTLPPRNK